MSGSDGGGEGGQDLAGAGEEGSEAVDQQEEH